MRPRQILTSLIMPATALSLPTSPASPRSPIEASSPSPLSARDDPAQTCKLYKYADSPIDAPACWAWYAATSPPSDYCGASTFTALPSSSTTPSTTWLDGCDALRADQASSPRDFFLGDYSTDRWNMLLTSGGCGLQVQPATPPSSDQVYVGGADVADVLAGAVERGRQAGGQGVEGSMTCSPGVVRWRVVPV
ncbi:hypothetical protein GGR52DRAFT_2977 [Hypoxylon sp. FL1284]|nr:hypothetical protein GGR52DRAFT_2977 [Hypoxylon sp. FL1284]